MCQHTPSRVSLNGYYTCQRCFEQVRHPWAPEPRTTFGNEISCLSGITGVNPRTPVETGIERITREADADWLRQIGVSR